MFFFFTFFLLVVLPCHFNKVDNNFSAMTTLPLTLLDTSNSRQTVYQKETKEGAALFRVTRVIFFVFVCINNNLTSENIIVIFLRSENVYLHGKFRFYIFIISTFLKKINFLALTLEVWVKSKNVSVCVF